MYVYVYEFVILRSNHWPGMHAVIALGDRGRSSTNSNTDTNLIAMWFLPNFQFAIFLVAVLK